METGPDGFPGLGGAVTPAAGAMQVDQLAARCHMQLAATPTVSLGTWAVLPVTHCDARGCHAMMVQVAPMQAHAAELSATDDHSPTSTAATHGRPSWGH